jgi:hypothetical protein
MTTTEANPVKAGTAAATGAAQISRKKKKTLGRKKRVLKLKTDSAFAEAYHNAKSKRSAEKKSAFRKKKSKKK